MSASLTPRDPFPPASGALTTTQAASHLISVCEASSNSSSSLPPLSQAQLSAVEASNTLRASPRSVLSSTFNTEPSYPLAFQAPRHDFASHYTNRAALYANPTAHHVHVSPKKELTSTPK